MLRSRRGIALILTLMVATLMAMLAGAFIGVNQSNIRLMGSQEIHRKALEAAQTGVEYAKMRMEQCTVWAVPTQFDPASAPLPNLPVMQIHEVREGADPQRGQVYKVVGVLNGGESHFQMIFVDPFANNLTYYPLTGTEGLYADDTVAKNPAGPPGMWGSATCVNSDISVNYMYSKPSDPILRLDPTCVDYLNGPPATYANATNRNVAPRRCRVVVLGYCKGVTRRIEASFGQVELTDASMAAGGTMAVSASGQWVIDSVDGENTVKANGKFYGPRVDGTKQGVKFGQWTAGGSARATGDMHLSDAVTMLYNASSDILAISGGGTPLDAAAREAAGSIANGEFIKGSAAVNLPPVSAEDVENLAKVQYKKAIKPATYKFIAHNKVEEWTGGPTPAATHTGFIPDKDGNGTAIYLKDGKFIVPDDHQISVEGSIEVEGAPGGIKPTIAVGFNQNGNMPYGGSGVLSVKGDIGVANGSVVGSGSVVAIGKDSDEPGRIKIAGKSDMSADPDLGVTMFSNSTVEITPPTAGSYAKIDFKIFQEATSGFAPGQWQGSKKMNAWGALDLQEKSNLAGNLSISVSNDTLVTPQNNQAGNIRTTDVTNEVGLLADPGSVLNTLVNEYDYVVNDPGAMASLTVLLDTYKTGGTGPGGPFTAASGQPLVVDNPGITTGRYLRLREWLRLNDEYLEEGGVAVQGTLNPQSDAWANVTEPVTNADIAHKVINQIDYYERQRSEYSADSLKEFFDYSSNPISGGTNDATFRGLIFSNSNIFCDLDGGSFFIDGGMIAKKAMGIDHARNVFTRYNPTYMDALTKELYLNKGWKKLKITYWASS